MAKLYFKYGTVGSAKTLNLLAVAHNYKMQHKKTLLFKPSIDTRYPDPFIVKSRAGLSQKADLCLDPDSVIPPQILDRVYCILVDEAQFLSSFVIDQLKDISVHRDIPVICYGLRADFRTHLFEGSRRLMEIASSIEEIKTTCTFCNKKALFNLKLVDGKPTTEGASIELGFEELFIPVCSSCYHEKLNISTFYDICDSTHQQKNVETT